MATHKQPDIAALLSAAEVHLSRAEIARRTGLAPSTVTMLASGERGTRRPSLGTYLALKSLVDALPCEGGFAIVNK